MWKKILRRPKSGICLLGVPFAILVLQVRSLPMSVDVKSRYKKRDGVASGLFFFEYRT